MIGLVALLINLTKWWNQYKS